MATSAWELRLQDDEAWRQTLVKHFEGIFTRRPRAEVDRRFTAILENLTKACKHKPWQPFQDDELKAVRKRWKNGKSCGLDAVSHEALKILLEMITGGESSLNSSVTCCTSASSRRPLSGGSPSCSRKVKHQTTRGRQDRSRSARRCSRLTRSSSYIGQPTWSKSRPAYNGPDATVRGSNSSSCFAKSAVPPTTGGSQCTSLS